DLAHTTPALFATRWVTHLCAPTFVFLAGASIWMQRDAAGGGAEGRGRLSRFLLTRGLWLVLLEITAVGFALDFAPFLLLEVIATIGLGMVAMAALVWAPPRALLALGAAGVAAFLALRAANGYGDPAPWAPQRTAALTALSFFKVTKQAPSLDFVLVTLGLSLPLGVAVERLRGPAGRMLLAFGR